jgi:hypothetical protein
MSETNEPHGPSDQVARGSDRTLAAPSPCGQRSLGPLSREWQEVEAVMDGRRNAFEREHMRHLFYLGARVASRAIAANHVAILLIRSELREFDREVRGEDEHEGDDTCRVVNIS